MLDERIRKAARHAIYNAEQRLDSNELTKNLKVRHEYDEEEANAYVIPIYGYIVIFNPETAWKQTFVLYNDEGESIININHYIEGLKEGLRLTSRPITITSPQYYEDDEPCGYCNRTIGTDHADWCRQ